MFRLAKTCPHCGAVRDPGATPKLEISSEEARALLATAAPSGEPRMKDVAAELVFPKEGGLDLVLTLIALPVTTLTLVVLGYGVLQAMRKRQTVNLRGARLLAVPTSTALAAVLLVEGGAPTGVWVALGASLLAWFVRDVVRARAQTDPLG